MHIEPGMVDGARMAFAAVSAAAALTGAVALARREMRIAGAVGLAGRSGLSMLGTLICFEVLPHFTAGVSEVHFIFGTALMLIFGAGAAALGLAAGLALQGLAFAPWDLPMYFVNVTTLVVPMLVIGVLARRILPTRRALSDLRAKDVLTLSAVYQGGIVTWVAFWVLFGQGVNAAGLSGLASFAVAYTVVLIAEPVLDLALLRVVRHCRTPAWWMNPALFVRR